MRTTEALKNKKNLIITLVIAVIVLITVGYGAFAYSKSIWPFSTQASTEKTQEEKNTLNQEDPTNTSDKNTGTNKGETENPSDPQTNKTDVQVGISFAGKFENTVEVRAFATGVIEGNGTCVATFSKDGVKVSSTSTAFIDTHTTQCEPIVFQSSEFTTGTWSLTVNYSSNSYTGTSATMEVSL